MEEWKNPGSDEAIEDGCVCSRRLNNQGRRPPSPPAGWWTSKLCPLHGGEDETEKVEQIVNPPWPFT